jgi:hemerythrin
MRCNREGNEMAVTTWKEEYSVNIEAIDTQHRKLLTMLNDVRAAVGPGMRAEAVAMAVRCLLVYVRTHFAHEEKLMRAYDYPGYGPHKREHEDMVRLAAELWESLRDGRSAQALDSIDRMEEMLMEHIVNRDKRYGSFFISRGVI